MHYSELLRRLQRTGIEQVGRLTIGEDSSIFLGKPQEIVFPLGGFQLHTFYAPAGTSDFWLDPEEISALLRRFELTMDDLNLQAK
jgi:hypothetical protein